MTKILRLSLLAAALALTTAAQAQTLVGWAQMPAATFSDGPTSGQFAAPNPYGTNLPPFVNAQPVQGFSAVLPGPRRNQFLFMIDNGFGAKANSADSLLRAYALEIDWKTARGGSGSVFPVDRKTGQQRSSFDASTRLDFNDAHHAIDFKIQADYANYYNDPAKPPVATEIVAGRLLTGADFDHESIRRDRKGNYWVGEEFGPYLVKFDANGTAVRAEIPLPGVYAPENKDVLAGKAVANLPSSGGFEGMAISPDGNTLYTLLEKAVSGDPSNLRRMNVFDINTESFTGTTYFYPMDSAGTSIGDMTAVDDTRFIVIERNGGTQTNGQTPFKKLFLIDIAGVADGGTVTKTELVDLMNIDDPDDLNGDGSTTFTLPYVTIENVLVLDKRTLLVANDNNFPYGGGRELASDNTEFLKIRLPAPLK